MYNQNTPEWEEMRKDKIGASDAPVIMGVSPWTTPKQLWDKKLNPLPDSTSSTWVQERGHNLEDRARHELEKMTGIKFRPQVKFHSSIEWMIASLDCMSSDNSQIGEIKCPGDEDHLIACNGKIPEKYFPQLQHQLEVAQLDMVHYFSFDGKNGVIVKVYRDDKYIKKMIEKEKEFWECMQQFKEPELTDRDYVEQTSQEWLDLAQEWKEVSGQLKSLEEKENQMRGKLIALSQGRNAMGGGIRVSKYMRKGNINYSSIPELKECNLEIYRKNPIESWRITGKK